MPGRTLSLLIGVALLETPLYARAWFFAVAETAQSPSRSTVSIYRDEINTIARTPAPAPLGAADKSESGVVPPSRIAVETADARLAASPENPLSAQSLERLPITRARPLFSSSRRPPAAPVAPVIDQEAVKPLPEPERPAMLLLGTIISADDQLGVFLENATQKVVHLRVGDDHQGWVLQLIETRRATLVKERGEQVAVLELSAPSSQIAAPPVPALAIPIFSNETSADEQPVKPARAARR